LSTANIAPHSFSYPRLFGPPFRSRDPGVFVRAGDRAWDCAPLLEAVFWPHGPFKDFDTAKMTRGVDIYDSHA